MGRSSSERRVNERSAIQMTAVYSCVQILYEEVESLPLMPERTERSNASRRNIAQKVK